MASLEEVRDFRADISEGQISRSIERGYNENFRDPLFREVKDGLLKVAASGVGKGMALVAALFVAGGALLIGSAGAAGWFTQVAPVAASVDFWSGLATGAQFGINALLFSGPGLLSLAAGGVVGGWFAVREQQDEVEKLKTQAIERRQSREIVRERTVEREPEPVRTAAPVREREAPPPAAQRVAEPRAAAPVAEHEPEQPRRNFCARIKPRAYAESFCAAETDRRAAPSGPEVSYV